MKNNNKKFTLIELLVVVAVIGILASLLLPSLGRARDSAFSASCKSRLKSLSLAMLMYADDNEDWAVFRASQPKYTESQTWATYCRLGPYLMDTRSEPDWYRFYSKKYLCPKASYALSEKTNYIEDRPYELRFSYGMNTSNLSINKNRKFGGIKFTQVIDPSNKILFSDSVSESVTQVNAGYGMYIGGNYEEPANSWNKQVAYRHENKSNIVYYDGHIGPVNHLQLTSNSIDQWTLSGYTYIDENGVTTIVP